MKTKTGYTLTGTWTVSSIFKKTLNGMTYQAVPYINEVKNER